MSTPRLVATMLDRAWIEAFLRPFRRVGIAGVLADTDRVLSPAEVPGGCAVEGYTWEQRDVGTRRWWPQGVATSGEDGDDERPDVVLTSWYAHGFWGRLLGARISVVDLAARRYRHVLLVRPVRFLGLRRFVPVSVHAGGMAWAGDHLLVAAGSHGFRVFRLDDVVRVRGRWRTSGYRYVLPQAGSYDASGEPMMYSFLSFDGSEAAPHLVVGEYGTKAAPNHRLVRYRLDPETRLPEGQAEPLEVHVDQPPRMQGAALVRGTWVVTASAGEGNPGDLWTGAPGAWTRHRGVLPTGPEDVSYWPRRHQVWSLTEWPGHRWLYALDADRWAPPQTRADFPDAPGL